MMAKAVAVSPPKTTMVVGADVDMDELYNEAAPLSGAGTSQEKDDNLIPYLVVLQDGSPQVKKRDPAYIEGAEPGMIMRTDIKRVYSGKDGVVFQPCAFNKKWIEWVPRDTGGGGGAGFVAGYDRMPPNASQKPDKPNHWFLPNGNDIVETRYHFGNLLDAEAGQISPCVIGMSSSQHTVSKSWMALMNQFRIGGSVIAPSFFRAYRLTTVERKNAKGTWFVFKPDDLGWLSKDLREMGHSLYTAVTSGEKTAADPDIIEHDAPEDPPF
jgi:hypothetical protein